MTLIEVVAGLAILGTLLVAALLAEVRCRRQSEAAQVRLEACQAAQALLEQWQARADAFPRQGSGRFDYGKGWNWRTGIVRNKPLEDLGGQQVHLELFAQDGNQQPAEPATVVDVVLPLQKNQADAGLHAD